MRSAVSRVAAGSDGDASTDAASTTGKSEIGVTGDNDDAKEKTAIAAANALPIVPAVATPVAASVATLTASRVAVADAGTVAGTSADSRTTTSANATSTSAATTAERALGASVDDDTASTSASGTTASDRGATRLDPTTAGKDTAAPSDLGTDAKAIASPFAATLADAKGSSASTSGGERTSHDLSSAIAAAGAAAPQATSSHAAGTASAAATIATPVDAPDFAAAFGMQVSVLAKDGVQQAQLHLNPADMGPVSIHITLDGTLAHVDFGADVAATRHAIEAGLPELASALRDAGFTLAGGGVAQHSASNGGGAGDDTQQGRPTLASTSASRAAVGALDASAQRQARRVAAGGVDLFA